MPVICNSKRLCSKKTDKESEKIMNALKFVNMAQIGMLVKGASGCQSKFVISGPGSDLQTVVGPLKQDVL